MLDDATSRDIGLILSSVITLPNVASCVKSTELSVGTSSSCSLPTLNPNSAFIPLNISSCLYIYATSFLNSFFTF